MTNIRLDRTQNTRAGCALIISPERAKAAKFFGIAHRRARSVAFYRIHLPGCQAALGICGTHGPKLAFRAGREQGTGNVVRQAHRTQNAKNAITMDKGIVKTFQ